jgi:hypothetical protein
MGAPAHALDAVIEMHDAFARTVLAFAAKFAFLAIASSCRLA